MWSIRHWPWWVWVVAVCGTMLCLLLSAGIVYRQASVRALQATIADLQAAGLPALPADLFARAPSVDRDRQERLWRIIDDSSGAWRTLNPPRGMDGYFDRENADKLAQDYAEVLAGSAATRSRWRALRQEGPLVISSFGWLQQDFSNPTTMGLAEAFKVRQPNLKNICELAQAFAIESHLSDDPRAALAELDALVAASDRSASLIDALVATNMQAIRDSAWLEATLRGTDPTPWTDNMPRPL